MEDSRPLHRCHVHKFSIIINRSHALLHSTAIAFLIYYRLSTFLFQQTKATPIFPWLLIFASELILSFIWLIDQAFRWRLVSRTVFPERLPEDDKLPAIDVFICTADPNKEPTVEVMNTVLSAMALDYPPEKLHVYLSDDGGSSITLFGMREAWKFGRWWLPFCLKYGVKTRCPKAYFSSMEDDHGSFGTTHFKAERQKIKEKYELFKERVKGAREDGLLRDTTNNTSYRDHPPVVEVVQENCIEDEVKMPLLVYVCREKKPSHPHHFKAGALNVLLRVSGLISNSPYILGLDCDMYCNDPTSAKQAMCFHLDPNISPSLAFVQFPQKFHNISRDDIYDSQIRAVFKFLWHGMDGLNGPILSGTNFYIKRDSLYDSHVQRELVELQNSFGQSNDFIKSFSQNQKTNGREFSSTLLQETKVLASCTYENHTKWGKEVGFMYHSVVEDYFTSFTLHCKGWKSVYLNPPRPQFLGTSTTNFNDLMIQTTRWHAGLVEVGISRFCPLIYGTLRMSFLQSLCYGQLAIYPLFYCLALVCFATIPQLCLLNGIPLYPEVSNPFIHVFLFTFISALFKSLYEVLTSGGSIQTWRNEQRLWMMKSVTSYLYGSLDAIMEMLGMREANFFPTNKVVDGDQVKLYEMGIFHFQTSTTFLVPLVTVVILNMASFVGGVIRMMVAGDLGKLFAQVLVSFYILLMNYRIIEAMIIRKDKGCIPPSVTLLSAAFSMIFVFLGSMILMY